MKTLTNPYLATLLLSSLTAHAAIGDRLVDPTRPADAKSITNDRTDGFRLEAIMRSGDQHVAIVSGRVVRAGDKVGPARIEEITADSIRYVSNGQSQTARLRAKPVSVRQNIVAIEEGQ